MGCTSDELDPAELIEHIEVAPIELFREPRLEPPGDEGGVLYENSCSPLLIMLKS